MGILPREFRDASELNGASARLYAMSEAGPPPTAPSDDNATAANSASPWATPTTRDWKDGANPSAEVPTNSLLGRQAPRATASLDFPSGRPDPRTASGGVESCGSAPTSPPLWPTPVANGDQKTSEAHLAMKRRMGERDGTGANRTAITSLTVMVKAAPLWPTVASTKATTGAAEVEMTDVAEWTLRRDREVVARLRLNPNFTDWLLGLPPGWTTPCPQEFALIDFGRGETPWSRWQRLMRGELSRLLSWTERSTG